MEHASELTIFFAIESFLGLFSGKEQAENFGGAEVKMAALARGLAAAGAQVVLLTTGPVFTVPEPRITVHHREEPIVHGVPYLSRFLNRARNRTPFAHATPRAVFLTSQVETDALADGARAMGVTVVYRINGDSLVDNSTAVTPDWHAFIDGKIASADALIVQSTYQQEQLRAHYGRESTVLESPPTFPAGTPEVSLSNLVLWVGRCVPVKRPWVFLELAKAFPAQRFVMAMPLMDVQLGATLRAEAELLPNLTIRDGVERSALHDLYREARLVVSTSWSEGIAATLIEAGLTDTPYLSYRLAFDEAIQQADIITCAHDDFAELVTACRAYLDDDAYCTERAQRIGSYARTRWDLPTVVATYIDYFLRITEGACA